VLWKLYLPHYHLKFSAGGFRNVPGSGGAFLGISRKVALGLWQYIRLHVWSRAEITDSPR
jgi:hypothetical protein